METVPHACKTGPLLSQFIVCDLTGFTKADNSGNVERSGAETAFMAAAIDHRSKPHRGVLANVKCATPFGAIKLMRGQGSQIDIGTGDIQRNLAQGLHSVRVEEHTALTAELTDFFNRLKHASFIIGRHNADQDCLVSERIPEPVK